MKSMKELMEELGFRENASESVKKAFIQNLIRSAYPRTPIELPVQSTTKKPEPEQLSFDIDMKSTTLLKIS